MQYYGMTSWHTRRALFILTSCIYPMKELMLLLCLATHVAHTYILGRPPPDQESALRRDLELTTHNSHNRRTSMPPAEFEPAIPANEWPQTARSLRSALKTEQIILKQQGQVWRSRIVQRTALGTTLWFWRNLLKFKGDVVINCDNISTVQRNRSYCTSHNLMCLSTYNW